ncbi:MAG TPA: O-methyltransferase [Clostridiales bacterium]|nr:O-methyltransferase [Clostridiales bacterium]
MIVDGRITSYINSLNKDISKQLINLENEAIKNKIPIIKKDTQNLLKYLLKIYKPKNILEVGTAIGFSALFMSENTGDNTKITTIEKSIKRYKEAEVNFKNNIYPKRDKIKLIKADAFEVLNDLVDNKIKFDFIFLDAAKAQYMNFLPMLIELLQQDAVLLTDNVLQDGTVTQSRYSITRRDRTIHNRMREYLYAIKHIDELETIILPVGDGVAISNRN